MSGFLCEIVLSLGILLLLIMKPFGLRTSVHGCYYVMLVMGICAVISCYAPVGTVLQVSAQTFFVMEKWTYVVKLGILLMSAVGVYFLDDVLLRMQNVSSVEIFSLVLLQTLGMFFVIMSVHWISLVVSLELMYLPMYALVALKASDKRAQEAACKYILMGALSTGIFLYGVSLIYAVTGDFNFVNWREMASMTHAYAHTDPEVLWLTLPQAQTLLAVGALFVTVGLLFKMGVAPFHWWVRDVYEGATYPVVALIGGAPKVVIALVWIRVFMGEYAALDESWAWIVFAVGVGSMYFGHMMALAQERIRALMAYSSLAHMGFVMIALALISQWGNQSAVFYTLGYGFTVVSVFVVLGAMQIDGRDVLLMEDLKGLSKHQPWLAFFLLCALFSLLGVPPFFGFFLKVQVLRALLQAKYYVLAVVSLIPMVIAAGYYLRAVSLMYFHDAETGQVLTFVGGRVHRSYFVLASVLLIALGVFPNIILSALIP